VLFARAVEPGTALNDYLLAGAPAGEVRRLGERLAGYVARLHDAGIHARDLHGWNILLDARNGGLDLCFVDLDELRARRGPALRHCADDLARLGVLAPVGRFTKLRFLANYLRARRILRAQWRAWHRAVLRRAGRLAQGLRSKYGREPEDFIRWFSARRNAPAAP
jgi:hypothetical protein